MSRKKIDISNIDLTKIGGRFAYVRLFYDLKQEEFAENIGLSTSNVSNVENHKYEPSFLPLKKLIEKYKVNPIWLLTGDGEPYKEVVLEDERLFLKYDNTPVDGYSEDFVMQLEAISRQETERRKQAESEGTGKTDLGEDIPIINKEGPADPGEQVEAPEEDTMKDESSIGIGYVVDQLAIIMNSKDPALRRTVLANLDALIKLSAKHAQINRMEKQLSSMRKEMKTFHSILDDIREILKKNQPPEGIQERRESWIEMKKTFGIT